MQRVLGNLTKRANIPPDSVDKLLLDLLTVLTPLLKKQTQYRLSQDARKATSVAIRYGKEAAFLLSLVPLSDLGLHGVEQDYRITGNMRAFISKHSFQTFNL